MSYLSFIVIWAYKGLLFSTIKYILEDVKWWRLILEKVTSHFSSSKTLLHYLQHLNHIVFPPINHVFLFFIITNALKNKNKIYCYVNIFLKKKSVHSQRQLSTLQRWSQSDTHFPLYSIHALLSVDFNFAPLSTENSYDVWYIHHNSIWQGNFGLIITSLSG